MIYRNGVAADHRIANSTKAQHYISKDISYGEREVTITPENVVKLLRVAKG